MKKFSCLITLFLVFITGCSKHAPECGSDEAKETIIGILEDYAVGNNPRSPASSFREELKKLPEDIQEHLTDKLIEYFKDLNVELVDITSREIDDKTLQTECNAYLKTNKNDYQAIDYSLAITSDNDMLGKLVDISQLPTNIAYLYGEHEDQLVRLLKEEKTKAGLNYIGQNFQGGIVFYLDDTKRHGLIAAPTDQSTDIQWYNGSDITTGATGTAIGAGKANTTAIVQAQGAGSYAAKLCDDLVLGGYSDWYLPSKDELNELYKNKDAVGGFANGDYWSSSENDFNNAWLQYFFNGLQYNYNKNSTLHVRAVRAF